MSHQIHMGIPKRHRKIFYVIKFVTKSQKLHPQILIKERLPNTRAGPKHEHPGPWHRASNFWGPKSIFFFI